MNVLRTVTLQDIKTKGAKVLPDNSVSFLIVNSKVKSAIVPMHIFEELVEAMEELEDLRDIEARKNEKTITLEELEASLRDGK